MTEKFCTRQEVEEMRAALDTVSLQTAKGTAPPQAVNDVLRIADALWKDWLGLHGIYETVLTVHGQYGDDNCWLDFDSVFIAAGLPVPDRTVGDPDAMLANCKRYITTLCKPGGGWRSYASLWEENRRVRLQALGKYVWAAHCACHPSGYFNENAGACPHCGVPGDLAKPLDILVELAELRAQVQGHAERIHAQSELLTQRACK